VGTTPLEKAITRPPSLLKSIDCLSIRFKQLLKGGPMARSGSASAPGRSTSTQSEQTRSALITATIETLRNDGFAGASARVIARRAGCNQSLVFYHFGSVANLLVAALDEVSSRRLAAYTQAADQARSLRELTLLAETIFEEELDAGYTTVLVELLAAARSTPGLGAEVSQRIDQWTKFAQTAVEQTLDPLLLAATMPASEVAYLTVATYLGLELLSHLGDDRTRGLAIFQRLNQMASLLEMLGNSPQPSSETEE
jgi:AcrR family transcriptional regulator